MNTLSSVGVSLVADLDKKQHLEERLLIPGMEEISNLLKEMEQYAHTGRYEQVQKRIAEAFVDGARKNDHRSGWNRQAVEF